MTTIYTTHTDAVDAEIIAPIENGGEGTREEFDIDAIAEEVIEWTSEEVPGQPGVINANTAGFRLREGLDTEGFWAIVAKHAR